jgi:transposase
MEADMSTLPTLGLDIAKAKFDAALVHQAHVSHRVFPNTPDGFGQLQDWLKAQGVVQVHVCLEATGTYGEAVALVLHEAGHRVSFINPARLKAYAQSTMTRTKTDKTDAVLLARFCQTHRLAAWTPPAAEVRELQALVRRLDSLQQMRQQEVNRLASGVTAQAVRDSLQHMLGLLEAEIAKLEQLIHDHIQRHPQLKHQHELLDSIPGIGEATATRLLAEMGDWHAYSSARQLAAQAGVTPKQHLSGTSVRGKPRLCKTGSARLRKILYWPAVVAQQHNPIVQALCDRLRARGKHKMVTLGAAMRKLLHLVYGVLKSGKPFDPNYRQAKVAA